MKRAAAIFLLVVLFLTHVAPLYAQATPTPTGPMGIAGTLFGDAPLIPGLNCGMPNDPDPLKTKCCAPKRSDDSVLETIRTVGGAIPVIGGLVGGIAEKIQSINALKSNIPICAGDPSRVVPSTPGAPYDEKCICIQDVSSSSAALQLSNMCKKYFSLSPSNSELQKCYQCVNSGAGFYTALGCIPLDLSTFIASYVLTIGIGIAGGIAMLCIIYSAFRMQTSGGNAEAIKKAQENMTACITGLIIIIFSVLILKIIGVDILKIPGFS